MTLVSQAVSSDKWATDPSDLSFAPAGWCCSSIICCCCGVATDNTAPESSTELAMLVR